MKKILFSLLMVIASAFTLCAQTGLNGINYQAVARNVNGTTLANQAIKVKISILGGTAAGTVQYQENHSLTTNQLGLFTLQIGKGSPSTGVFANVPWQNANQFLKVELAVGNGGFSDLGTTQLMSVPYALFAANSNPGVQGPVGPKGDKGDPGTTGAEGLKGDKGDKGDPGLQGIAGLKGDKGDKGDQGLAGPQGLAGATGPIGPAGPQGTAGTIAGATAGGDLSGVYPDPTVVKLQGKMVSNVAPLANQYLKYDGTKWLPAAIAGGGGFTLPYEAVQASPQKALFAIKNTDGTSNIPSGAIQGESNKGYGVFGKATEASGIGVLGLSEQHVGVWGTTNSTSSAAGYFYVPNAANTQPALIGHSEGTGAGIYGGAESGTGIMADSETGSAAEFKLTNSANTSHVLKVSTQGTGKGISVDVKGGEAIAANSTTNAFINATISAFNASTISTSNAILGNNEFGVGIKGASNDAGGIGVMASGKTNALGLSAFSNFGPAAKIYTIQPGNNNTVLEVSSGGTGVGVKSTTNTGAAIEAISGSSAVGGVAVYAELSATATGTNSSAVRGFNKNTGPAKGYGIWGIHSGANGAGVFGQASKGRGVEGYSVDEVGVYGQSANGTAAQFRSDYGGLALKTEKGNVEINGQVKINDASVAGGFSINAQTTGSAIAGYFVNLASANPSPAILALTFGSGPALIATSFGAPGTSNVAIFKNSPFLSTNPADNVARIDNKGRGFFNDGTQTGGADIAEAFDITGNITAYEPGDILVISLTKDRTVEKSSGAYSNLIAGVYATKPGVLLTEAHIDADISGKVPMGVIGVVPTKVCLEGGAIKRGDMLVTSSQTGVAMKADLKKVGVGQVLGKALQDYNQPVVAKINVLVNIK